MIIKNSTIIFLMSHYFVINDQIIIFNIIYMLNKLKKIKKINNLFCSLFFMA